MAESRLEARVHESNARPGHSPVWVPRLAEVLARMERGVARFAGRTGREWRALHLPDPRSDGFASTEFISKAPEDDGWAAQ